MGGMALCETIESDFLELPGPPRSVFLGARVPCMGWTSAVGVTQMAHRNIVRLSCSPHRERVGVAGDEAELDPTLPLQFELRRDRPCPVTGHDGDSGAWAIYIDDLAEGEIFTAEFQDYVDTESEVMGLMDLEYGPERWNCPGSDAKKIDRQAVCKVLGTVSHGTLGRRDTPDGVLLRACGATCFCLSHSWVPRRWLQVVAGRWSRCQQRNRATACSFQELWKAIASGRRNVY